MDNCVVSGKTGTVDQGTVKAYATGSWNYEAPPGYGTCGCSGDNGGNGGCSGDNGSNDNGGCSGDNGSDNGGCSGDNGSDNGGCSGGTESSKEICTADFCNGRCTGAVNGGPCVKSNKSNNKNYQNITLTINKSDIEDCVNSFANLARALQPEIKTAVGTLTNIINSLQKDLITKNK